MSARPAASLQASDWGVLAEILLQLVAWSARRDPALPPCFPPLDFYFNSDLIKSIAFAREFTILLQELAKQVIYARDLRVLEARAVRSSEGRFAVELEEMVSLGAAGKRRGRDRLVFIHPSGPVKAHRSRTPLLSGAVIDARTLHIISTSCQNCHSEKTDWPWYSYVAPASWLLESDVHRARSHLNFSRWAEYSTDQRIALLSAMQNMVQTHMMPLPRYLWLHPGAKLSEGDIDRLSTWTWTESNRLRSASVRKG